MTLTSTIHRSFPKIKNISIVVLTVIGVIISFYLVLSILFSVGFNSINTDTILYSNKLNPKKVIVTQTIGQGAFGGSYHRVVKLEPFLKFWNHTTKFDTSSMNKVDWILINKSIK